MEKIPKQLSLFEKKNVPEWKARGFKSRAEWLRAKAYDRAFRHMKQMERARAKKDEI